MNKVYLLGAGVNHDLKFYINKIDSKLGYKQHEIFINGPLFDEYISKFDNFWDELNNYLPVIPSLKINKKNFIAFLKTNEKLETINIEKLYLRLEKISKNSKTFTDTAILNFLKEYIHNTLAFISYYCFSIYHRILARQIIKEKANIISFNWDILLEEELKYSSKWSYLDGYGIDFDNISEKVLNDVKSKNRVLKPHGSINWYRPRPHNDEKKLFLEKFEPREGRGGCFDGFLELSHCKVHQDKSCLFSAIVPPGENRDSFPEIWKKIEEILKKADEILIIGFSCGENDQYIPAKLKKMTFKNNLTISLIDPNDSLITFYKEIFKTNNVKKINNSFKEYVESLNV